jgi:hypothetical protein
MCDLVALEELNRALVLLGGRTAAERAEVSATPGLRVLLARIEPVLPGFQLPDHRVRARVLAAFRAAALREAADRRRAALFAWRDSAFGDAALRPSRFSLRREARERRGDGRARLLPARLAAAARFFVEAFAFLGGAGSFTPARRAFERPIAIACLVDRAPCLPSRMWWISSRMNSPA